MYSTMHIYYDLSIRRTSPLTVQPSHHSAGVYMSFEDDECFYVLFKIIMSDSYNETITAYELLLTELSMEAFEF